MKHYIVNYYKDFANTYNLAWVEAGSPDEVEALADGWERITRKEAIRLCSEERYRRRTDEGFSGFADAYIIPYNIHAFTTQDEALDEFRFSTDDGYIYTPIY